MTTRQKRNAFLHKIPSFLPILSSQLRLSPYLYSQNIPHMADGEKTRIDKYLWSIRLFKTRAQATDACDKGRIKINTPNMGMQPVKASRNVNIGDVYEVKTEAKKWSIKVTGLIAKRVGYPDAIKNYEDITPQEELDRVKFEASSFHTGKRLSKIGHPSKRDRRDLESFLNDAGDDEP